MTTKTLGSATAHSIAPADAFSARWVDHESGPAWFPGTRLVFQHLVTPVADGVELSVLVTMHGPLAFVWTAIMGGGFHDAVPADLERLIAVVEAEQPAVEPRSPGAAS